MITKTRMKSFITYEILFHRADNAGCYILREMRFVSAYSRLLSSTELDKMKKLVITKLINEFTEADGQIQEDKTEPLLAITLINT